MKWEAWLYDHPIKYVLILVFKALRRRSQWSRDLRRGSAAARLLVLWIQIPPEAWIFVCCCHVKVSASDRSLVQSSPAECGVPEGGREASRVRRHWPTRGYGALERKSIKTVLTHRPFISSLPGSSTKTTRSLQDMYLFIPERKYKI